MVENEKNVRPSDREEPERPKKQKLRVVPKKEPIPIIQPEQTRKRVRRKEFVIVQSWRKAEVFNRVPRLLSASRLISLGALGLATILLNYDLKDYDSRDVFPSLKLLKQATGHSIPTIQTYLKELHKARWIETVKRGRNNTYLFTWPVITTPEELVKEYSVSANNLNIDCIKPGWANLDDEQKRFLEELFGSYLQCLQEAKDSYRKGEITQEKIDRIALNLLIDKGKRPVENI